MWKTSERPVNRYTIISMRQPRLTTTAGSFLQAAESKQRQPRQAGGIYFSQKVKTGSKAWYQDCNVATITTWSTGILRLLGLSNSTKRRCYLGKAVKMSSRTVVASSAKVGGGLKDGATGQEETEDEESSYCIRRRTVRPIARCESADSVGLLWKASTSLTSSDFGRWS
ncbi:hypothetical protein BT96DRAFT_940751 [Gymnopus androsaceus JB14]|uniref:Uncharacterized protein n=1 Tax=Gymnopus androsaceus JB14 TaxID=1447944 RepID=A0A6A4HKM4_9AGAR|nr:hypothetical protein BT96DRAFT_940751 [Gymnopus androsaceus JB14]